MRYLKDIFLLKKQKQEEIKMEEKYEMLMDIVKEVMKLPVDKETNTVKVEDITKLCEELSSKVPEADSQEYLQKHKTGD